MTIANDEKFTIVKNFLFYTYHRMCSRQISTR